MTDTAPKTPTKRERIDELTRELATLKSATASRARSDQRARESHLERLAQVGLLDLHALHVSGVNVTVSSPSSTHADEFFWEALNSGVAVPPRRTITITLDAAVNNRLAQTIHEAVSDAV
jgi:hypothetical protein